MTTWFWGRAWKLVHVCPLCVFEVLIWNRYEVSFGRSVYGQNENLCIPSSLKHKVVCHNKLNLLCELEWSRTTYLHVSTSLHKKHFILFIIHKQSTQTTNPSIHLSVICGKKAAHFRCVFLDKPLCGTQTGDESVQIKINKFMFIVEIDVK